MNSINMPLSGNIKTGFLFFNRSKYLIKPDLHRLITNVSPKAQ